MSSSVPIEVKLGADVKDLDVSHLLWLKQELDDDLVDMLVITSGPFAYRRTDGVAVVRVAGAMTMNEGKMEPLSAEAVRVLGVLIEKELSTPDYYPMTLNALTNGCNQKSNRDPVVAYEESEVLDALDDAPPSDGQGLRGREPDDQVPACDGGADASG